MIKVHHYVGFIGWRNILEIMASRNQAPNVAHFFYCDSYLLWLTARVFGFTPWLNPGPLAHGRLRETRPVIWSGSPIDGTEVVLPFFSTLDEIRAFAKTLKLSEDQKTFIGISSPKQNVLAQEVAFANLHVKKCEIWCFGAAIYLKRDLEGRRGFLWPYFFLHKPLRTVVKISGTLSQLIYLAFCADRRAFRFFLHNLEHEVKVS